LHDLLSDAVTIVKTSERGKRFSTDIFSRYFPLKRKQKIWKSSARHKEHGNYSMNDIAALDPQLAAEIAIAGRFFGYSFRPAEDSHSAFEMRRFRSEGAPSENSLAGSRRELYECP
jgi:hypothetical protein